MAESTHRVAANYPRSRFERLRVYGWPSPGMMVAPADASSQAHLELRLLNVPCDMRPVFLISQMSVCPGAQVSLALTFFGRSLFEAQAQTAKAVSSVNPAFFLDIIARLS